MTDPVPLFLLRWFTYLDILGRLSDDELISDHDIAYNEDGESEYDIDCLMGFTPRCGYLLFQASRIIRACDRERARLDSDSRANWRPLEHVYDQAIKLCAEFNSGRTDPRSQPNWDFHTINGVQTLSSPRQLTVMNEIYHWAGFLKVNIAVLGRPALHSDILWARHELLRALKSQVPGSGSLRWLFPKFFVGRDNHGE
jgi:hypothetical protein